MIIVNKGADYSALGLGRAFIPEDQISNEVKTIMSHYSNADIITASALQEFFNSIGSTLKAKIRNMILPIFASNIDEAIYDIITDTALKPVSGSNRLAFDVTSKRVRPTGSEAAWPSLVYSANDTTDVYTGNLVVASNNYPTSNCTFFGCDCGLNSAGLAPFQPNTTNNKKIIGAGLVSNGGTLSLMRLTDTNDGDKVTEQTTKPTWWSTRCPFFGKSAQSDTNIGTRIFVASQELLTVQEAKTLRDAVLAMDNKFFG
jgi:hypothetical protein